MSAFRGWWYGTEILLQLQTAMGDMKQQTKENSIFWESLVRRKSSGDAWKNMYFKSINVYAYDTATRQNVSEDHSVGSN